MQAVDLNGPNSLFITVERNRNAVHVYLPTREGSIVTVSLYGQDVGSYSDERLISLARDELKRKLDSPIFALVRITPTTAWSKLLCENCATAYPDSSKHIN